MRAQEVLPASASLMWVCGAKRTGTGLSRTTSELMLPENPVWNRPCPRVPITMTPTPWCSASCTIACGG